MVDVALVRSASGQTNGLLEHDDWFNRVVQVGAGVTLTLTPRTAAMESPPRTRFD